ncbi:MULTISPECIES: LysR family transcriptional regulator [Mycobacteriaceae]|uniref:Probable hydrogen peroxide-inducible genes activator n=2 Tax=Mycobacteriaceae TaxID=1762 RepID=F5YUK4_MYCSD|nr:MULTISPECIES: LysR substrate-binding domain-containing protein [Mycobacteriaceae]AEF35066.1 hydrogen peroxide-inducible genes activator OxyR [Mycolicibacter sinensis]BBX11687.1 transcriptional regulator [Mycobacterium novum]
MEVRQLQHFVAVAESGHFTHAAEALNISQSGLSASIQALEKSLSTPVFERTTRSVVLTAAGRALLGPARRILAEVTAAEIALAAIRDAETGRLALGVVQTFTAVDLPATIARLHAGHPGIQVLLREAPTSDLLGAVDNGDLDLAFVALDATPLPTGLAGLRDYPETLVLVVGAGHVLSGRTTVRITDLAEESFVEFAAGLGLQTVVAALFRDAGVRRRIAFRTSQMDQALSLVEHGLGVAVVPAPVARRSGLHSVGLRPISGAAPPTRRLALVGRTAVPTNPAARAFLNLLPAA